MAGIHYLSFIPAENPAEERSFQGHSHIHAYCHLPPACFAPENWGGETLEELAVWVGEAPPAPTEQGQLLFLEP